MTTTTTTAITSAVAQIIEEAEAHRSAYFFRPPTSAGARRSYEKKHSVPEITWTEGGHTYSASYSVRCTCSNVYASGEYTRDGAKTTLTAIRNSLKRMQNA